MMVGLPNRRGTKTMRKALPNCAASLLDRRVGVLPAVLALALFVDTPSAIAQTPGTAAFLAGKTKDCPGCNLAGASMKRRNLAGANLAGANLNGASFHRAVLRGANLSG